MKEEITRDPHNIEGQAMAWYAPAPSFLGRVLLVLRLFIAGLWTAIMPFVLCLFRGVEYITKRRDLGPYVTQIWARGFFLISGIRLKIKGKTMDARGAVVANHASWLDIIALQATARPFLISKSEVAGWPVIGWLARLTRTEFVERRRGAAVTQNKSLARRLAYGDRMAFFPEGTTTDSTEVLPFKSTLFAAFVQAHQGGYIQPVTLVYSVPKGASANFFGWYGTMALWPHIKAVLSLSTRQTLYVTLHEPIPIGEDRKALAKQSGEVIKDCFKKTKSEIQPK